MKDIATLINGWTSGKLVMKSGYYAGRGVTSSDLNSDILEMIYVGIKKDVSPESASNFVRFVNSLTDLSASAFIVAFEKFWYNDCNFKESRQDPEDRIRIDGRDEMAVGQALGLLGHIFGGDVQDEEEVRIKSFGLKSGFIYSHQKEIPDNEIAKAMPHDDYDFYRLYGQ